MWTILKQGGERGNDALWEYEFYGWCKMSSFNRLHKLLCFTSTCFLTRFASSFWASARDVYFAVVCIAQVLSGAHRLTSKATLGLKAEALLAVCNHCPKPSAKPEQTGSLNQELLQKVICDPCLFKLQRHDGTQREKRTSHLP